MNLFAYGTLLVPKIWEAVTGVPQPQHERATLFQHEIFRVSGGDFPGIVESADENALVPGRLFLGLPQIVIQSLDRYEDSFYERIEVTVNTAKGPRAAQVYRVPPSLAADIRSPETWTLEWFESEALDRYCARLFG